MSAGDYLATANVWQVLDLIVAEFKSDPQSTQCFDRRIVDRAIALNDAHRVAPSLGATGEFPRGQLDDSDEGEISIGITVRRGTVLLAFGKPVGWLGLPPQMARDIGRTLQERADEAATVS